MKFKFSFQGEKCLVSDVLFQDEREIADLGPMVEVKMQNFYLEESGDVAVGRDCYTDTITQVHTGSCQELFPLP